MRMVSGISTCQIHRETQTIKKKIVKSWAIDLGTKLLYFLAIIKNVNSNSISQGSV